MFQGDPGRGILGLAVLGVIACGAERKCDAAITTYVDFSTSSANHGFSSSTNYTPNSTPTSSTLVDVDGADTAVNYVSVYGGSLTTATGDALSMGTLVFDSVSTNSSYVLRSQSTSSSTATTAEFDATLTLSGGDPGTTPGTTTNGGTTVNVPQTAANDLLVLTSNLGGKTINLEGFGAADTGITTAGSGNISVAGVNGDNLIIAVPSSGNFDIATGNELNFTNFSASGSGGSKVYTAALSGAGTITVTGGGTLRMVNSNSNFTGGFNVSAGSTLLITGGNGPILGATPTSSTTEQVTLNGGTFEISSTFGTTPLGVARQISLIAGATNTIDQLTGYTAIAGQISGGGSLVKAGAGTIILPNTESYTGTTEVAAGDLLVDGSIASNSQVSVDGGGLLGGIGTTPAVITQIGSLISPGDPNAYTSSSASGFTGTPANAGTTAIGTLTIAGLTMASGSIYDYDIASTTSGDLLNVTGTVTGDGGIFNLYVAGTTTPVDTAGTYNLISQTGGYTGGTSAVSIGDLPSDMTASFGIGSNGDLQVTYTLVPEPTAVGVFVSGAVMLMRRRRRIAAGGFVKCRG